MEKKGNKKYHRFYYYILSYYHIFNSTRIKTDIFCEKYTLSRNKDDIRKKFYYKKKLIFNSNILDLDLDYFRKNHILVAKAVDVAVDIIIEVQV